MARKPKFDYFQAFIEISDHAVSYADALVKYLEKNLEIAAEGREPDIEHALKRYEELHKIETDSDQIKHDIIDRLAVEFLAPIEREDVMMLANELDDLVDDLDEVLQRMYMYDVHIVSDEVIQMARLAHKSTIGVQKVCSELANFKKSKILHDLIVEVNDVEEEADSVYIHAMHDTYAKARDMRSIEIMGIGQLLGEFEKICDACEDVCDTVATIVMKNS